MSEPQPPPYYPGWIGAQHGSRCKTWHVGKGKVEPPFPELYTKLWVWHLMSSWESYCKKNMGMENPLEDLINNFDGVLPTLKFGFCFIIPGEFLWQTPAPHGSTEREVTHEVEGLLKSWTMPYIVSLEGFCCNFLAITYSILLLPSTSIKIFWIKRPCRENKVNFSMIVWLLLKNVNHNGRSKVDQGKDYNNYSSHVFCKYMPMVTFVFQI